MDMRQETQAAALQMSWYARLLGLAPGNDEHYDF